jgi:hypothetical protein
MGLSTLHKFSSLIDNLLKLVPVSAHVPLEQVRERITKISCYELTNITRNFSLFYT